MPRLDLFTLREQMRVALFVPHFRRAEVKSLRRLGLVADRDTPFLVGGNRIGERDDHVVMRHLVALNGFGGRHGADVEVDTIEFQFADRFGDGLEADRGCAFDRALFEIRRDIQRQVQSLKRNYQAEQSTLECRAKELQIAQAPVEEKIKSLTEALAFETKRREAVERLAVDSFKRRQELEADYQRKHDQLRRELQTDFEGQNEKLRQDLTAQFEQGKVDYFLAKLHGEYFLSMKNLTKSS